MAQIVLIHGIGQQASTVKEQEAAWLPSLVKGVLASGHPDAAAEAARIAASADRNRPPLARMAFYGDLYLPTGTQGEEAPASPAAEALADDFAAALLARAADSDDPRLAAEAANALRQADPDRGGVQGLGARIRGAGAVLDGNAWLTARIFGALQKAWPDLLQVTRYLTEDDLRAAAQARVAALLGEDTKLVIGHSLGSVLAWESCQALAWPLPVLVTLGSPLGLDTVVYPRLRPQPPAWPPPELAASAEQAARSIPHPDGEVRALADLALAMAAAGDHDCARELAASAEQAARAIIDPAWQGVFRPDLARAVAAAGDHDRAEQIARSVPRPGWRARALADVARAAAAAGDHDRARDLAASAEQAARAITYPDHQAEALADVAGAAAAAGDHDRARHLAR